MFKLIQWSDSHLQNDAVSATQNLISKSPNIDFTVNCGDITNAYFQQGIGVYDATKSVCVIGNHDSIDQKGAISSGYQWKVQVEQTTLYTNYLEKSKTAFEINIDAGKTYWYKIFTDKKVIVIGINDTLINDAQAEQYTWFTNVIKKAIAQNLTVVFVSHAPVKSMNVISSNWNGKLAVTEEFLKNSTGYISAYGEGYDKPLNYLLNSNANVACVLCGHTHFDCFGTITKTDNTKVPFINVGSTLIDSYNDIPRTTDVTKTASVVANMIEFDNSGLRLFRLGSDGSTTGAARKMLAWSYVKQDIVASCSVI